MIIIIFEAHATTFDNEKHVSSGHNDVALSPRGVKQAKELGERYKQSFPFSDEKRKDEYFDTIFCSDLQRSYKTAEIAFGDKFPIIKDKRLRECDYGDLTQHPSSKVDPAKVGYITEPFPNGESYGDTSKRMKDFLDDLKKNYDGKRVMIVGHRATQYGLEHWVNGKSLEELVTTPFKWQPGWTYSI